MLLDDLQLVQRDTAIPGLPNLLGCTDDDRLRALLRWDQASAIRCEYLRYKPQSSCLVGLAATIDSIDHYATIIAFSDDQSGKLAKLEQRSSAEHLRFDTEHLLALGKFPFDRRLPALEKLIACDPRMLNRLLPTGVRVSEVELRRLRYKPERRYVTQIDYQGVPLGTIKLYAAAAFRGVRRVVKTLGDSHQEGETRAIGHIDRHGAISFHWQPGAEPTVGSWPTVAKQAARELSRLHMLGATKLPQITQVQLLRRLREAGEVAAWLAPEAIDLVRSVQSAVARRLSESSWNARILHGDMHLGQMLLDGDQFTLIDFDRASLGPAELDLAHLSVDLHGRSGTSLTQFSLGHLLSEFLCEYERLAGVVDRHLLAVLTSLRLFEASLDSFRNRAPHWKSNLEEHLRAAGQILDDTTPSPARRVKRYAYPADERLPWLACACDCSQATRRISSLPGSYIVHRAHLARHKPGRRAIIEYHVSEANGTEQRLLLGKTEHKPRHNQRIELQQQLWQSGFDSGCQDGISVARPIGAVPEWNMWLQEHVSGVDGWKAIEGPNGVRFAVWAAQGLAKLHRATITVSKSYDFDDERQLIDRRLAEAVELAPHLADPIEELRLDCLGLCDRQLESEQVVLHRDYYPAQLLLTERGIVLLDLDLVCRGPASIDIGNFTGHLAELGIRKYGTPDHFADAEQAFVEAYLAEFRSDLRHSVQVCKLLTLARHVHISLSRRDRRHSAQDLLNCCQDLMANER